MIFLRIALTLVLFWSRDLRASLPLEDKRPHQGPMYQLIVGTGAKAYLKHRFSHSYDCRTTLTVDLDKSVHPHIVGDVFSASTITKITQKMPEPSGFHRIHMAHLAHDLPDHVFQDTTHESLRDLLSLLRPGGQLIYQTLVKDVTHWAPLFEQVPQLEREQRLKHAFEEAGFIVKSCAFLPEPDYSLGDHTTPLALCLEAHAPLSPS
ncbi:MAG: hypothetical protein ACK5O7_00280 [Holosporales bacterium]